MVFYITEYSILQMKCACKMVKGPDAENASSPASRRTQNPACRMQTIVACCVRRREPAPPLDTAAARWT